MGEYARHNGREIKIGTCESMYYLRFDQRHQVEAMSGNVDPVRDADALRFRFPFPDEDGLPPGDALYDKGYDRGVHIPGAKSNPDADHGSLQFASTTRKGYLVSLPCPEAHDMTAAGAVVHRNGTAGGVELTAVRYRPGIGVVPVMRCAACGTMWRMEGRDEIEELAMLARAAADKCHDPNDASPLGRAAWWHKVADRILEGINEAVTV